MPGTLPSPDVSQTNYPPGIWSQLNAIYKQSDFMLTFPVTFATADAAVIWTVPTGVRVVVGRPFWEVTTGFSGGTLSAIGLSSSNAAYSTKGDLLGGATGDVAAGLTAGFRGTVGAKVDTFGLVVLIAADTIRFDRVASIFTAGAALAHIPLMLVPAS